VQDLYEIKGRPEAKAVPLLLASPADLIQVAASIPPAAARLAARFWPGPLTMVLEARPEIPAAVLAGGHTVAVRVPDHPVARALIDAAGAPLATTSANRSGAPVGDRRGAQPGGHAVHRAGPDGAAAGHPARGRPSARGPAPIRGLTGTAESARRPGRRGLALSAATRGVG
jgi:tRNA A37 threonylcarbamoyladenosine synthetase subunit TsaC/SUA5/YrdC